MLSEAIPLALVASIYPLGIAGLLVYFSSDRPRPRSVMFLAGAVACTLTVGILVVVALRTTGMADQSNSTPNYRLELGIGILFLVLALILARRKPSDKPSRFAGAANASLFAVFIVGVALYTPSPSYLTALHTVGTANDSVATTAISVLIVVAIVLWTIWVPLVLFIFAPDWTRPKLERLNEWLRVHGKMLFVWVLVVLGLVEIGKGLSGLL